MAKLVKVSTFVSLEEANELGYPSILMTGTMEEVLDEYETGLSELDVGADYALVVLNDDDQVICASS
jgi:hypothetical protein